MTTKLRECKWCGATFFPNPSHKVYCSVQCRHHYFYYRDLDHTHANQRRQYRERKARKQQKAD